MPDVTVYTGNPTLAQLLENGAQFNVIFELQRALVFATGEGVLGLVGAVINDRGEPNLCVDLAGKIDDLRTTFGGFKSFLGEGHAAGYEGNLYARAKGIDAPRIILQPVDLALKDKTITDDTAVDLEVTVARGALAFTTTIATETFNCAGHPFANGDTVQLVTLLLATGVSVATTYYIVGAVAGVSFQLSLTDGGAVLPLGGSEGSGYLRPISEATPDYAAFTMRAGTRLETTGGGFIVRTLEDVDWAEDEFEAQSVRVAKVSGSVAGLDTVDEFVDTLSDTSLIVCTPAGIGTPDDVDAPELLLRYQRAFDTILDSPLGQMMNVVAADRDEAGIGDMIDAHIVTARGRGYFRSGVTAPPVGTSAANAEATTGDGVGRTTITGIRTAYTHQAVRRSFLEDSDNLTAPAYLATIPGAIAFAARIANTRAEENPARPHQVLQTYGIVALEAPNPSVNPVTHFRSGIVTPEMVRQGNRMVASFRDGIFADGTKIADGRLKDFLASGILEVLANYHKEPGSKANRQTAEKAVQLYLRSLVTEGRIFDFATGFSWDATIDHLRVKVAVDKNGNMDTITLELVVGGNAVSESGIGVAA